MRPPRAQGLMPQRSQGNGSFVLFSMAYGESGRSGRVGGSRAASHGLGGVAMNVARVTLFVVFLIAGGGFPAMLNAQTAGGGNFLGVGEPPPLGFGDGFEKDEEDVDNGNGYEVDDTGVATGSWVSYASLHDAARANDANAVRAMLEAGANVDARDIHDRTPLHWAADASVAWALLEAGANVDARDKYSKTPLLVAVIFDSPNLIRALLDGGADIEARDDTGFTPLISATQGNNPNAVRALVEEGADVNAQLYSGHSVCHFNSFAKIEILKSHCPLFGIFSR